MWSRSPIFSALPRRSPSATDGYSKCVCLPPSSTSQSRSSHHPSSSAFRREPQSFGDTDVHFAACPSINERERCPGGECVLKHDRDQRHLQMVWHDVPGPEKLHDASQQR